MNMVWQRSVFCDEGQYFVVETICGLIRGLLIQRDGYLVLF